MATKGHGFSIVLPVEEDEPHIQALGNLNTRLKTDDQPADYFPS